MGRLGDDIINIAIIELGESHYAYLYSLCRIFSADSRVEKITIFVNKNLNKIMKDTLKNKYNKFNWIIKDENKSSIYFFRHLNKQFYEHKFNYLFINSLQDNFLEYLYLFLTYKGNKILTIHNINNFINNSFSFNLKTLLKSLIRKLAFKKSDIINVYGDNLKKYLIREMSPEKPITTLPFSVFENNILEERNYNNKLKIVIPGAVDSKRRNYKIVYEVTKKLITNGFDFKLVLLGSPTDKDLIKSFEKLGDNIKTYKSFVPEVEFKKQMLSSDLIWNNINKYYVLDDIVEEYGLTKETGINFSVIRYATPAIVSSDFKIMSEIESSYFVYKDEEDLYNQIINIINNRSILKNKSKQCKRNSEKFTPEKIAIEFHEELSFSNL